MNSRPIIGVDWGTSRRRAYLLNENGVVIRRHADDMGVLNVPQGDFASALRPILSEWLAPGQSANVLLSGSVGSREGWVEIPYLPIKEPLYRLPLFLKRLPWPNDQVQLWLVPGISDTARPDGPDMMRGEETQLLGAIALEEHRTGVMVLPGTHSKWVSLADGHIRRISTYLTGELFAAIRHGGTLARLMREPSGLAEPFMHGVNAARDGGLTRLLFGARAKVLHQKMPVEHMSDYVSGLLIGAEFDDALRQLPSDLAKISLIGDPSLVEIYTRAAGAFGLTARSLKPDAVYVAALKHFQVALESVIR